MLRSVGSVLENLIKAFDFQAEYEGWIPLIRSMDTRNRDELLLAEIPTVLRAEFYAVAAMAAAAIVVIGQMLQLPVTPVTAALISCSRSASWRSGSVGGFRLQKIRQRHDSNTGNKDSKATRKLPPGRRGLLLPQCGGTARSPIGDCDLTLGFEPRSGSGARIVNPQRGGHPSG